MYKVEKGQLFWVDVANGKQTMVDLPKAVRNMARLAQIAKSLTDDGIREDFNAETAAIWQNRRVRVESHFKRLEKLV